MKRESKSSLLWGLIGGLSFLVLIQAYHILTGEFVGISVMGGVAVVVFALSAISAHLLRPRIRRRANERT